MCSYWAVKIEKVQAREVKKMCLAFKGGTGKITFLQTTQKTLGPEYWTLVTRSRAQAELLPHVFNPSTQTYQDEIVGEEENEDIEDEEDYYGYDGMEFHEDKQGNDQGLHF